MYTRPLDSPTAGEDTTLASVVNVHRIAPVDVDMPYTLKSNEPTYSIEPSTDSTGDEYTRPPVREVHSSAPAGLKAYTFLSLLPTNTMPLMDTVAEDSKKPGDR